jgi:aminoglycoside phosphotransferase (APT) family kinase protein
MTLPPWTAEVEVSPQLASSLIGEQFPQLAPVHVEPLGVGFDNVAFVVNERYVFRFPRRTLGATLLESELKLMPAIAQLLPLPVANPIFVGRPCEQFRWPFGGYELIRGREFCRANVPPTRRHALAVALGAFLRSLHSIPANSVREHGGGPDTLRRLDVPYRAAQTREKLEYIRQHGLFDGVDELSASIESVPTDYPAKSDVLVHGDLYSRHLIVNDEDELAGVIDWGDVHLGDRATDLMAAWITLSPQDRVAFFQRYGPVDELTQRAARFRALNHTCNVVPYAHQTRDPDLLRECLLGLTWLAQA